MTIDLPPLPGDVTVADVGGTNTRVARGGRVEKYRNDDFPGFGAVMDAFFAAETGARGRLYVCGAGPEEFGLDHAPGAAERLTLTNRGWVIERGALCASGFSDVSIFNDLYAAASGVIAAGQEGRGTLRPVCGQGFAARPRFAVVGIGTGVGCAAVGAGEVIMATEAGHMPAALDAETMAAFEAYDDLPTHPSYERVLSGTGLAILIRVFGAKATGPADIVPAARAGDEVAQRILRVFHDTLGHLLSAVVAAYRADGGVCVVSDFLRGWGEAFDTERVAKNYLRDVPDALGHAPVALLDTPDVPLMGLARLARMAG